LSPFKRDRAPQKANEILRYFVRHPHAADSVEGIVRWRLMQETIAQRLQEVDSALDWLLRNGFVIRETMPGAAPVFRLNPARLTEAEQLLRTEETSRERTAALRQRRRSAASPRRPVHR
jgi:hypothetical protein